MSPWNRHPAFADMQVSRKKLCCGLEIREMFMGNHKAKLVESPLSARL